MGVLVHIFLFVFSAAVIWFFAGLLIESVDRVARRFHTTGFTVAFFVLGFLTSISEISVAVNATVARVPEMSVGNLVGASFVILLFIIPSLAVAGKNIELRHTLSKSNLQLALATIFLPVLFVIDGDVTRGVGLLILFVYLALLFAIRGQEDSDREVRVSKEDLLGSKGVTGTDGFTIIVGGLFIFLAGHFLVEQSVYFANLLSVPSSLIGLMLLSVGTNVPELVIAVRSILKKHKDIAFGDYIGSAAANTLIFGLLPLVNGGFGVETSGFTSTALLMLVGLVLFYFFARSKRMLSRNEGLILLLFYGAFLYFIVASLLL